MVGDIYFTNCTIVNIYHIRERNMMKLNKRKLIILGVLIISVLGMIVIYLTNNKPRKFDTDIEKENFIREFAKPQGNDLEINVDINAGGNAALIIDNIGVLMKYSNVDLMFSVNEKILSTIKAFPSLYKDTMKLNDLELKSYFEENKKTIVQLLGIEEVSKFEQFIQTLKLINGEEVINATINESTLKKVGNSIVFSMNLKAKGGNEKNYEIEVIELEREGKTYALVYWK